MIEDIHSHTYYSGCGRDEPSVIIEAAISSGIELFGICDHNYGIGDRKTEYLEKMTALKEKYRDRIKLLCGIELATIPGKELGESEDISGFDYCLIEHIDCENTVAADFIPYAKALGCRAGIAHTDLFAYCKARGYEPSAYFAELKRYHIFWEMNVNYDSIHGYREHAYVIEFHKNEEQQKIVADTGLEISVGFDGHRTEDYDPQRVKNMCAFLESKKIRMFAV